MTSLRLATRSSPLAIWQATWVAALLRGAHPRLRVQVVPVVSSGDRDRTTPLYESSTVGVFVREIQEAVMQGRADAGVHSCKDLPTTLPPGLLIAAIPPREDPRDCLVGVAALERLDRGAVVGTSSLRRQLQLARLRPDLRFVPIRGNVETRLRRVAQGEIAATILACAGLSRLGLRHRLPSLPLDPLLMVPAPGQGAVALDCQAADRRTRVLLAAIDDRSSHQAVTIERRVLAAFAGGCSLPLGCLARRSAHRWSVVGRLSQDGATHDAFYHGLNEPAAAAITAQLSTR